MVAKTWTTTQPLNVPRFDACGEAANGKVRCGLSAERKLARMGTGGRGGGGRVYRGHVATAAVGGPWGGHCQAPEPKRPKPYQADCMPVMRKRPSFAMS